MIKYEFLELVLNQDVEQMNRLIGQLTDAARPATYEEVCDVAKHSFLLIARNEEDRIVGMNTLSIAHIPTGKVGHLDDVVVDGAYRGKGIGKELVRRLIKKARVKKVDRIELTCRPERESANRLYPKLGFKRRETNCYLLKLR